MPVTRALGDMRRCNSPVRASMQLELQLTRQRPGFWADSLLGDGAADAWHVLRSAGESGACVQPSVCHSTSPLSCLTRSSQAGRRDGDVCVIVCVLLNNSIVLDFCFGGGRVVLSLVRARHWA